MQWSIAANWLIVNTFHIFDFAFFRRADCRLSSERYWHHDYTATIGETYNWYNTWRRQEQTRCVDELSRRRPSLERPPLLYAHRAAACSSRTRPIQPYEPTDAASARKSAYMKDLESMLDTLLTICREGVQKWPANTNCRTYPSMYCMLDKIARTHLP